MELGDIINDFIYDHNVLMYNENKNNILKVFFEQQKSSENMKLLLNNKIGPHLSNPYYVNDLNKIIQEEKIRQDNFFKEIDISQYNLIINEEKLSYEYYIRINNNFEAFISLFDFMLLEEDFLILGGIYLYLY